MKIKTETKTIFYILFGVSVVYWIKQATGFESEGVLAIFIALVLSIIIGNKK